MQATNAISVRSTALRSSADRRPRVKMRFAHHFSVLHPGFRERTLSSLDVSQFESDHPGKLNSTAVMRCVWQYLAAAAYPSPHSSNAKSLCGAFSADSPKIEAPRARLRS